MSNSLEEILRRKKADQDRLASERPQRIEKWRFAVSSLIDQTYRWLTSLQEEGLLQLKRELINVREEGLGEYEIPTLHIVFVTGSTLSFRPIGTNVIGAYGRVDVITASQTIIMIVYRGEQKWEFARRESRYGSPKTWPYNKESLETFLADYLED